MPFQNIIGHERIKDNLENVIQTGKIKHAYLFTGQEHLGKFTLACEFARILNKKNYTISQIQKNKAPDIIIIQPEAEKSNLISIKQIRELQRKLSLTPFESKYKIAIIDQSHFLRKEAANALLKTLEEPSDKAILILISTSKAALLSTIVSRCEVLKFWPVSQNLILQNFLETELLNKIVRPRHSFLGQNKNKLKKIMKIAHMRPGIAFLAFTDQRFLKQQETYLIDWQKLNKNNLVQRFKYVENLSKNSSKAEETLKAWIFYLRSQLINQPNTKHLNQLKKFQESLNLILNTNANPRLVLEVLMMEVFE